MSITHKEYNRRRYNADYRASVASRVRSAANLLEKIGCCIVWPSPDAYERAVDEYAQTCPRRERIDWAD